MELDEYCFLTTAGLLRNPAAAISPKTNETDFENSRAIVVEKDGTEINYTAWIEKIRNLKPTQILIDCPWYGTLSPDTTSREETERLWWKAKRSLRITTSQGMVIYQQTTHLSRKYPLTPEIFLNAVRKQSNYPKIWTELKRSINAFSITLDNYAVDTANEAVFEKFLFSIRGRELFDKTCEQFTRSPFDVDFENELAEYFEGYDPYAEEKAKLNPDERANFIPYPEQVRVAGKLSPKEFIELLNSQYDSKRAWEEVARFLVHHVLFGSDRDAVDTSNVEDFIASCDQARFLCLAPVELVVAAQRGVKASLQSFILPAFLDGKIKLPPPENERTHTREEIITPVKNSEYHQIFLFEEVDSASTTQKPSANFADAKKEFVEALNPTLTSVSSIDITASAPFGLAAFLIGCDHFPELSELPADFSSNKKDLYQRVMKRVRKLFPFFSEERLLAFVCAKLTYLSLPVDHKDVTDFVEPTPEMVRIVNRMQPARESLEVASLADF